MPLDFQRRPTGSEPGPRRAAPPNYLSRRVQRRLLFLVATFMLVIILLAKVRDPRFWSFMGFQRPIAGGPPLTSAEVVETEVDTRLRWPAPPTVPPSGESNTQTAELNPDETPLDTAERDAWHAVLTAASGDEQLLLYEALDRAEENRGLAGHDSDAWSALLTQIDQRWSDYVRGANASLDELPEENRASWRDVLSALQARWTADWRPRLVGLGAEAEPNWESPWTDALRAALDRAAVTAIRDDMVARPQEKAAWFRWLAQVRDVDPSVLKQQSLGPTGFLQLYKQPNEYRGKVVTVRGVAHLAYHVEAPPNRTNIPGYYLFWVHPAGGPNSPIVIYSLETPPGFPPIQDKDRDRATTRLNEEVEFTGYFFKRWAYESQGGIHVAPLLLARAPQWQPPSAEDANGPSLATVLLIVAGTAIAGIGIAWVIFRRAGDGGPASIGQRLLQ